MPRRIALVLSAAVMTTSFLVAAPAQAASVPTSFRVVPETGVRYESLRLQWAWQRGTSRYDLQVATDRAFTRSLKTVGVSSSSTTRPSNGLVAGTVPALKNATIYYARVRAVSGTTRTAWSTTVTTATKVHIPGKITTVSSKPGPAAGQVTVSWQSDGTYTTRFSLETALTLFSTTDPNLPRHGRRAMTFYAGPTKRSLTLTAAQVASAGASLGSANHLYFRLRAVNKGTAGSWVRSYPYLQAVSVKPATPSTTGTALRVASFNVRTASADGRSWLSRAASVASTISTRNPGVVTLQELSPGRADGKTGSTSGSVPRQTESLEQSLSSAGAGRYQLVRTTPYIEPGRIHGSQGVRILYDTSRYGLKSSCPETTGGRNFSASCTFELPVLSGDSESMRRTAAYAVFETKSTTKRFLVVSAHLDARRGSTVTSEKLYEGLRESQMNTILAAVARINTSGLPVVFGGDINTWQNNQVAYGAHDRLIGAGFYDTAAAVTTVNLKYPTVNHYVTTLKPVNIGYGARLDVIAVKGVRGAARFENVMKVVDSLRPSDHNMVYADIRLPS